MSGDYSLAVEAVYEGDDLEDGLKDAQKDLDDLKDKTEEAGEGLDELGEKAKAAGENTKQGTEKATAAVKQMAQESQQAFDSLVSGIQSTGDKLSATITPAMAAVGTASVVLATDFESSMSRVSGALDDPTVNMQELSDLALQMGADTVFSATEAGDAMESLAKGGLTAADIKGGALASTMNLAAAGGLELATAADTIVKSMGAFEMTAEQTDEAANALAGAAAASASEVSDLTLGLSQVGQQANSAGWSIQDTTAVLAAFANAGMQGSDAGTSLKTMLQRLAAPTDDAAAVMEQYGINVRDANGNMLDAAGVAQELHEKLGSLSSAEKDAAMQAIFGSDASRAALAMTNLGAEGLKKYTEATNDQTAAQRLAESQMGETERAIEEMKGAVETAAIQLGSALAPVVADVAESIGVAAEEFANLDEGTQRMIIGAAAAAAGLGPFLSMTTRAVDGVKNLQKASKDAKTVFTAIREIGVGAATGLGKYEAATKSATDAVKADTAGRKNNIDTVSKNITIVDQDADAKARNVDATNKSTDATKKSTSAMKLSSAAMTAAKGAAVGLAIAGIALVAAAWYDAYKRQQEFTDATDGLIGAVSGSSSAVSDAAGSFGTYGAGASNAAKSVDELIESQAKLAQAITERNSETATSAALIETYGQTIEEMAGRADLSEADLARFQEAVDGVNESCGTSYTVAQNAAGEYVMMADGAEQATDSIWKLIDAQQNQLRAEAAGETYKELFTAQQEAAATLAEAKAEYDASVIEYNEAVQAGMNADQLLYDMQQAEKGLEEAQALYDSTATALSTAEQQQTLYNMALQEGASAATLFMSEQQGAIAILQTKGQDILKFTDQLNSMGLTQEQLAKITPEQLGEIASSYDGTVESIITAMAGMSDEAGDYGKEAIANWKNGMSSETQSAIDAALEITGLTIEEFYKMAAEAGVEGEEAIVNFAQSMLGKEDEAVGVSGQIADSSNEELGSADTEQTGEDFVSGFIKGIGNMIKGAIAKARELVSSAKQAADDEAEIASPSKAMMESGQFFAEGFALGIEDGTPEAEKASVGLVDESMEPLSSADTWVYGYHAAVNYAEGLSSGSSKVKDAASGLASAATDEMSEAEREMQAYIDSMIAGYEKRIPEVKEKSQELADAIWGTVYPQAMAEEYVKPVTGEVYDSMKILEGAGYSLESYMSKYADLTEKMKSGNVSDSVKADYEEIMALNERLTASTEEMAEWAGLYKMKDDLISGLDSAETYIGALDKLFSRKGVTFSKTFVEGVMSGGEEYQDALVKMADMTDAQVQEMVDSWDSLKLAEREQELAARSLYVNSLENLNMQEPKEWMLDFRETCLDVKEAIYSNSGLSGAFDQAGVTVEGFALDLQALEVDMSSFVANLNSFTADVSNGFSQMTKYGKTGLAEWSENLRLNMAEAQAYAQNLETVFSNIDPSIDSEAFRQAVYEGGFEQWGQVIADMAAGSTEQIGEAILLYNEAIAEGQLSAIEQFRALSPGEEYVLATLEGLEAKQADLNAGMADAATQSVDVLKSYQPQFVDTGAQLAQGIASGIQSQIGSIAAAAAATVRAAIEAAKAEASIASPSKTMRDEVGEMLTIGMAVGIERVSDEAVNSMRVVMADTASVVGEYEFVPANQYAYNHAKAVSGESAGTSSQITFGDTIVHAVIRDGYDVRNLSREINDEHESQLRARGIKL